MFATSASGEEQERKFSLSSSERHSRNVAVASLKRGSASAAWRGTGGPTDPISQNTLIDSAVGQSQEEKWDKSTNCR